MNLYNQNLDFLCERRKISITEFERLIYIPKVRIMEPTPDELVKISDYFSIPIDLLIRKDLRIDRSKFKKIKFIILDVDGTMTDGGMYYSENGDQFKKYNTKDGMAIKREVMHGTKFGIISHGHKLNMIQDRAALLGIDHIYVGQEKKLTVLEKWCAELGISKEEVAFVGDDSNDIEIMHAVGLSACPADAVDSVKAIADMILTKNGGAGCVREFLDEWLV